VNYKLLTFDPTLFAQITNYWLLWNSCQVEDNLIIPLKVVSRGRGPTQRISRDTSRGLSFKTYGRHMRENLGQGLGGNPTSANRLKKCTFPVRGGEKVHCFPVRAKRKMHFFTSPYFGQLPKRL